MSIGLTARELAQMRADIEDLFPDTCDILSVAYTADSEGGFAEAWGTAIFGQGAAAVGPAPQPAPAGGAAP